MVGLVGWLVGCPLVRGKGNTWMSTSHTDTFTHSHTQWGLELIVVACNELWELTVTHCCWCCCCWFDSSTNSIFLGVWIDLLIWLRKLMMMRWGEAKIDSQRLYIKNIYKEREINKRLADSVGCRYIKRERHVLLSFSWCC